MPEESFTEVMNSAWGDGDGDTATATPETTAPAAETTETTAPNETPTADTGSKDAPTGDPEWKFDQAEFDEQHPELAPYRKQLQADYTRRTQEIAEQRKAFEAIDPEVVRWTQYVQTLMQTNPAAAAELLRQEAERTAQLAGQQPREDPYAQTNYATENERALGERLRQVEQMAQQQEQARVRADIDRRFSEVEQQYKTTLPFEERQKVCQFCLQHKIADVGMAWKVMNYDRAVQSGVDRGAAVTQQKAGLAPPPAGTATRQETPVREPGNRREALEQAYDEAGG